MWKLAIAIVVVGTLVVMGASPALARGGPAKQRLTCGLELYVTVPGVEQWDGNKLTVTGQQLQGGLVCNLPEFSGAISITQDATVKVHRLGGFNGKVSGTFGTDSGLAGEIKGRVFGRMNESGVVSETVIGQWNAPGVGKGVFAIRLKPVVTPYGETLGGQGLLTGKVESGD